jgi:hypothetical protein
VYYSSFALNIKKEIRLISGVDINMDFNESTKIHPPNVAKTFGFEITVYPAVKPKYKSLERY